MGIREMLERLDVEFGDRVYKDDGTLYARAARSALSAMFGHLYADAIMKEIRRRNWKIYQDTIEAFARSREHDAEIGSARERCDWVALICGYEPEVKE